VHGRGEDRANHYQHFIDAVRANDRKLAMADIKESLYSCELIHLANISHRIGRSLEFDPKTMSFENDNRANRMLIKEYMESFVVPDKV
jgi:hypothetical protein